nr:MAG TPA: hypothetical protein [Caudoviricetes sp.]
MTSLITSKNRLKSEEGIAKFCIFVRQKIF